MTRRLILQVLLSGVAAMVGGVLPALASAPNYQATVAALGRLAGQSTLIRNVTFGKSAEGRPLAAAVVAANGATTPAAARAAHDAVVFVVSGMRVGDLAGKDAVVAWLDHMVNAPQPPAWLKHVVVVAVPALNADGLARLSPSAPVPLTAAFGAPFQGTPGLISLSHDFLYARSATVRAWLSLVQRWHPDAFVVLKTNLRQPPSQYRLTWSLLPAAGLAPPVAHWQAAALGELSKAFTQSGLTNSSCYRARDVADLQLGLNGCVPGAGSLAQLAMLTNRPEVGLVLPRRPYSAAMAAGQSGLDVVLAAIDSNASDLLDAVAAADRNPGTGSDGLALGFTFPKDPPRRQFDGYTYVTMLSPISGSVWARFSTEQPKTYFLPWAFHPKVSMRLVPWQGYAVPAAWRSVLRVLAEHGAVMHRVASATTKAVRAYFLTSTSQGTDAGHPWHFTTAPQSATVTLPAGSVVIPADQPEAKLVAALLQPDSPVSFVRGGYFDRLFQARVHLPNAALEEKARSELRSNPGLAREFARHLTQDPAFAANPARRLAYFLQHHNSGRTPLIDVYPVYELLQQGQ